MSEKEKKIIETIAEALPNMSERDKGVFPWIRRSEGGQSSRRSGAGSREGGELSASIK